VEELVLIEAIPPNQVPVAFIDSISPNPAKVDETIIFSGHGEDEDGSIDSYTWESNIDGLLNTKRSFSTSSISQGEHIISFKVEDDSGEWSDTVTMILVVEKQEEKGSSNELIIPILLGLVIIVIMGIVISLFLIARRKRSLNNSKTIHCPNCGSAYSVKLIGRPFTVQCPICDFQNDIR
jgi:hypothetical protein